MQLFFNDDQGVSQCFLDHTQHHQGADQQTTIWGLHTNITDCRRDFQQQINIFHPGSEFSKSVSLLSQLKQTSFWYT